MYESKRDIVAAVVWVRIRCVVFHKDVTRILVLRWNCLIKPVTHSMGVGLPSALFNVAGACHVENRVMPEWLPVKVPGLKTPPVKLRNNE